MQFYLQIAERSQSWHKDTVKNRYLQENGLFLSDTPLLSSTPQATAYRNKEHGKQYLDGWRIQKADDANGQAVAVKKRENRDYRAKHWHTDSYVEQ